jgi:hypothetical protein
VLLDEIISKSNRAAITEEYELLDPAQKQNWTVFPSNPRLLWNGWGTWTHSSKAKPIMRSGANQLRSLASPSRASWATAWARIGEPFSDRGRSSRIPSPAATARK